LEWIFEIGGLGLARWIVEFADQSDLHLIHGPVFPTPPEDRRQVDSPDSY